MKLNLLSAIPSMNHRQPGTALDRLIALFLRGFMLEGLSESLDRLERGKSVSGSTSNTTISSTTIPNTTFLGLFVGWTNPDHRRFLTQSGRGRFKLLPT